LIFALKKHAVHNAITLVGLFRLRYSFIFQSTSTRRQRSDLFGLRVKLPPVTTNLKGKGNPVKGTLNPNFLNFTKNKIGN